MKTQKLIVIGLIAVIAIVGIGIYIYADIQTQHGMTVEKYCEKYDCHIVEYKYYDADGNSCGSIKMHSNYILNIVELDTSNFHPPGGL